MIRKIYPVLIALLVVTSCSTPTKTDPIIDKQLYELLDNKYFFKLRTELERVKDKLSEDRLLYYQAYCNNVFDKCEESNKNIEALLSKFSNSLSDSIVKDMLDVKASNSIRLYRYKEAADAYSTALNEYKHVSDSSDLEDYANMMQLFGTLAEVKPQLIHKHNDIEIKGYHDDFDLLRIPVQSGGINEDFVFDSGAGLSTIALSYAQKMNMKIYESDISVGTVTHAKVQTMLAVADSLYVGDLLFENVVFLVAPDENLNFPEQNFYVKGIIGFPVMHQMEEVHLRRDGSLYVPSNPQSRQFSNMYLNNLSLVVRMISGADTLTLSFDTGARTTDLSKRYFDNHKEEVEKNGTLAKSHRGGASGVMEVEEYDVENFPFTIGSKSGVLDKASISIDEFDFMKNSDGTIGQDIISQFDEMVLNFKYMYIDFS
ncbi:MAG: retroviral-like aspartic protease family protein [Prevotellaceae bacterium]|jgi:hypothetical protein|nr:retroviral-like aspartic protease family protein [Prevotellaceae bacterium]